MSKLNYSLKEFLEKLNEYEPGIIGIIKNYTKTYTFNSNEELKDAVTLWNENKDECIKRYGHISYWDTSNADMSHLFKDMKSFNEDISRWDTSKVENMGSMFSGAESFNQDISSWDTSNVTNMGGMFYDAESFNVDISSWKTSKVKNMGGMFWDAESFNQDISTWDTSNVEKMQCMFYNCHILEEYKPVFN